MGGYARELHKQVILSAHSKKICSGEEEEEEDEGEVWL